jgi:hypothetical protein
MKPNERKPKPQFGLTGLFALTTTAAVCVWHPGVFALLIPVLVAICEIYWYRPQATPRDARIAMIRNWIAARSVLAACVFGGSLLLIAAAGLRRAIRDCAAAWRPNSNRFGAFP